MFTVLSRPYDDNEIVEVYLVEHHDSNTNANHTPEQFEFEWMTIKNKLLEKDPEYNVTQVIKALEKKGWQIIHTNPAKVTY